MKWTYIPTDLDDQPIQPQDEIKEKSKEFVELNIDIDKVTKRSEPRPYCPCIIL